MASITYSSTRGGHKHLDFRSVVLQGLAPDRGLFVPDTIPTITASELQAWKALSYPDLAVEVLAKFVGTDQVPAAKLRQIVHKSCAAFRSPDVTPVVQTNGHYVLELFHGPTFAFKDVALQMLGNFFEYFLQTGSNDGQLTVLGATSGDTGSAAIAGLRGKRGVQCVILFPNGRVSEIQERQMTTVPDPNVHCVAIEGTFDDCQDLVKASFNSPQFRKDVHLGAVNSINWCRVLAQTTYYVWTCLRVQGDGKTPVHFSVPTGNFGDVLAGYYAKQMGMNVGKLIVATNENDILHRFFTTGEYHRESIQKSISPSMDICVSSNFERYLFHLSGNNSETLGKWMSGFESTGKLTIEGALLQKAQSDFLSARADTALTLQTIKEYSEKHNYLLCPHSAVGVAALPQLGAAINPAATVCLATADQGKFPAAVRKVVPQAPTPPALAALATLPTRRTELPNDLAAVQSFVRRCVAKGETQGCVLGLTSKGWIRLAIVAALVAVGAQVLAKSKR